LGDVVGHLLAVSRPPSAKVERAQVSRYRAHAEIISIPGAANG
jgi:hypothetical protein